MAKRSGHLRKFNDPADTSKPAARPFVPAPPKAKAKPAADTKAKAAAADKSAAPPAEPAKKDGE